MFFLKKVCIFLISVTLLYAFFLTGLVAHAQIKPDNKPITETSYEMTYSDFTQKFPNGEYKEVDNINDLVSAMSGSKTDTFIKITKDIDIANSWTLNGASNFTTNSSAIQNSNRYEVNMGSFGNTSPNPTENNRRTVVLDGKLSDTTNAKVNFWGLGIYSNTQYFDYYMQNMDMYSTYFYGFWSAKSSDFNQTMTFHNINAWGDQFLRSDRTLARFSGYFNHHLVETYDFGNQTYRTISGTNEAQGNLQIGDGLVARGAKISLYSGGEGNIQFVNTYSTLRVGAGAELNLDTSDKNNKIFYSGNSREQAPNLDFNSNNGSLILEDGSKLSIASGPTRKFAAINMRGNNTLVDVQDNASIDIQVDHGGVRSDASSTDINATYRAVNINAGGGNSTTPAASINIGENATFNINATGRSSTSTSLFYGANYTQLFVSPKGSFTMTSDANDINPNLTSAGNGSNTNERSLIRMGNNSTFVFSDAKLVDLKYTDPTYPKNLGLININGNSGFMKVDVQKVKRWTRGDVSSENTPNFKEYSPMFGMFMPYNNLIMDTTLPSASATHVMTGASILEQTAIDFKNEYNTLGTEAYPASQGTSNVPKNVPGWQRMRFEFIPDVAVNITSTATDDISSDSSKIITGTATPGSYVRLTTTPVTGSTRDPEIDVSVSNTIKTPVQGSNSNAVFDEMLDDYTFIVDDTGTFSFTLPSGSFNAGTTIKAYAFKEGKTNSVTQVVKDATPPTAESKPYYTVVNGSIPDPSTLVQNVKDSNPLKQNFTYEYATSTSDLNTYLSQPGNHTVQVNVYDEAKNKVTIDTTIFVYDEPQGILADDITVTQTEFKEAMSSGKQTLEEYLISQSNAYAYQISGNTANDLTDQIKVGDFGGLTEQTESGEFNISLNVSSPNMSKIIKVTITKVAVPNAIPDSSFIKESDGSYSVPNGSEKFFGTTNYMYSDGEVVNKAAVGATVTLYYGPGPDMNSITTKKMETTVKADGTWSFDNFNAQKFPAPTVIQPNRYYAITITDTDALSSDTRITMTDTIPPEVVTKTWRLKKGSIDILPVDAKENSILSIVDESSDPSTITSGYDILDDQRTYIPNNVGYYDVSLIASDAAGNNTTVKAPIIVYDDVEPTTHFVSGNDFSIDYDTWNDSMNKRSIILDQKYGNAKGYILSGDNTVTDITSDDSQFIVTIPDPPAGGWKPDSTVTVNLKAGDYSKDIIVTLNSKSVTMKVYQVYKQNNSKVIYSNLENETPLNPEGISQQVDIGSSIQSAIDTLISNSTFSLNYDWYQPIEKTNYKVLINGAEYTSDSVPDTNFDIYFEYEGLLDVSVPDLDYGSIKMTSHDNEIYPNPSTSSAAKITNTTLNNNWTLSVALPNGIQKTTDSSQQYLGGLIFNKGNTTTSISDSAVSFYDNSEINQNLLTNLPLDISLYQNTGNTIGSYKGELVWTIQDGANP